MLTDPGHDRDGGFTLIELIVVVLLVSVLASVMVAVVAVVLRNAPSTEARAGNSHSYQRLITRLARDAASTPLDGFKTPTTAVSGPAWSCSGISEPTLVQMSWSLGNSAYVAGYRLEVDGDGKRVVRYACTGLVGDSVFPNPTVEDATDRLHNASPEAIYVAGIVVGVRIDLTMCGEEDRRIDCTLPGPVVSVEASSRNPGPTNTLPPP